MYVNFPLFIFGTLKRGIFIGLHMFFACLLCSGYFPMQNLEKIFASKSSDEISPVIVPK